MAPHGFDYRLDNLRFCVWAVGVHGCQSQAGRHCYRCQCGKWPANLTENASTPGPGIVESACDSICYLMKIVLFDKRRSGAVWALTLAALQID